MLGTHLIGSDDTVVIPGLFARGRANAIVGNVHGFAMTRACSFTCGRRLRGVFALAWVGRVLPERELSVARVHIELGRAARDELGPLTL